MTDSRTDTFRILDAAANRAREGLRVVEDYVRFALNDGHLSGLLKGCRHHLTAIVKQFPASQLLACRDTLQDVGTAIQTPAEYQRSSTTDVVSAAFKRTQEALRTLEEFSKLIDASVSPQFERLRYDLYTAEKAVLRTDSAKSKLRDQRVYLLVQAEHCQEGFSDVVNAAMAAGVRLFQLREKTLDDRELLRRARQLRQRTRAGGAMLIVNDRPDIAVLSDADGVHVGQEELTVHDARRIVGPDRVIGVSTHSIEQARQAVLDGADYLGVGPTFPSGTKSFEQFPGLNLVRAIAQEIQLPWFAIGGIDQDNIQQVIASGASRVAVSGAICRSQRPGEAARELLSCLDRPTCSAQPTQRE